MLTVIIHNTQRQDGQLSKKQRKTPRQRDFFGRNVAPLLSKQGIATVLQLQKEKFSRRSAGNVQLVQRIMCLTQLEQLARGRLIK